MATVENYKDKLLGAYVDDRVPTSLSLVIPSIPTGLYTVGVESEGDDGNIIMTTEAHWHQPSESESLIDHTIAWKVVGKDWSYIDVSENVIVIPFWLMQKDLVCKVRANGFGGSSLYTADYSFNTNTTTTAPEPPLNLRVPGGGAVFADDNVTIGWDNNPVNDSKYIANYLVTVYRDDDASLVKEYAIPVETDPLAGNYLGGAAIYHKEKIISDFSHPVRAFTVKVSTIDKLGRASSTIDLGLSNPAPLSPTGTVTTFENDVVTTLDPSNIIPDISNLITAVSTTAGFDPTDRKYWLAKVPAQRAVDGVKYSNVSIGTLYGRFALDDTYSDLDLNWSVEVTVNVTGDKEYITPDTPTGIIITKSAFQTPLGEHRYNVKVGWVGVSTPVTNYTVEWSFTGGAVIGSVTTTEPSFTFLDVLADDTDYSVRVKAVYGDKSSAYTALLSEVMLSDAIAPANPSGLEVNTGLAGSLILSWTPATDTDYKHTQIYQSTTDDIGTASEATTSIEGLRTIYGLTTSTPYYFWVRSVDYPGNESDFFPATTAGVSGTPT